MCAGGIDLGCLYYFPIIYLNCSGGVVNFAFPFIVKHKYIKDENRRCSREKEMKLVQYFSFSPAIQMSYLYIMQSLVIFWIISILIKDEVLITVICPIFPSILIAKYLFTGSLKNRSIDNLETQKKYISMKNSQFFNYLLYAKSK